MSRHARLDAPGTLHNIMARSNERTDIFSIGLGLLRRI